MKQSVTVMVMLVSVLLYGCSTQRMVLGKTGIDQNTTTYEVFGMDCPGCHGGLEKNLLKIPGVIDAVANWKQKTVTIKVESGNNIELAVIEKAIKDSNFTLGKVIE